MSIKILNTGKTSKRNGIKVIIYEEMKKKVVEVTRKNDLIIAFNQVLEVSMISVISVCTL